MKNKNYLFIVLLFIYFAFSFSILKAQPKEILFENVSLVTEHNFNDLEDNKAYEWIGIDGNSYAIKKRGNEKYTGIKYNGEWVRHGVYFKYGKSYDKPQIEYLEISANYRYGKLHGEYKWYRVSKGKSFLSEIINYSNGIKNGEFAAYDSKDFVSREGSYDY